MLSDGKGIRRSPQVVGKPPPWPDWIQKAEQGGCVPVSVNGEAGPWLLWLFDSAQALGLVSSRITAQLCLTPESLPLTLMLPHQA